MRQRSNTSNLIVKIPRIIAYVSTIIKLQVGDVILTGTPGGVGMYMDPPNFLKPGDTVKCSIEKIGELENRIVEETIEWVDSLMFRDVIFQMILSKLPIAGEISIREWLII